MRQVAPTHQLHRGLDQLLGTTVQRFFQNGELIRLEEHLAREQKRLKNGRGPFGEFHNGTEALGRLCYAVCRALQPEIVVETGVAYGVTSAYILQALAENGEGRLLSIDLPPLSRDSEAHVGVLVPEGLRKRWSLRVGSARKLLPALLAETGGFDVFLHDSLHTYAHMKWELESALSVLRPGGVIIADDIEGNRAFEEILSRPEIDSWFAIQQGSKSAWCGATRTKGQPSAISS